MSDKKAYIYDAEATPFNLERLAHELKASPLPPLSNSTLQNPQIFTGKLYITYDAALTAQEETDLDALVAAHDGTLKSRTSKELQEKRETVLAELVDLAHFHPVLKNSPDEITGYLTSIDNWFNAWKRDGNHAPLVAKITADGADNTHPNFAFLDTVVDTTGAKTWQFIISRIPTTPYI